MMNELLQCMTNTTFMLSLLLGFSVALNLIIAKRLLAMNILLDLLVKHYDMRGTWGLEKDVQQLSLILRHANIRYLFQLRKRLQNEPYLFFIQSLHEYNKSFKQKSSNASKPTVN